MNVEKIVKQYLEEHGFDGLAHEECGCSADNLFVCGCDGGDCQPAYEMDWDSCSARKSEDGCFYGYTDSRFCDGCFTTKNPNE